MKRKIFQKWLVTSLLVAVVIFTAMFLFAPELTSQSSGPEIHYYYNSANALIETADSKEFISEIESSETVNSVYVLDYEPYEMSLAQYIDANLSMDEVDIIKENFRKDSNEYYSSKNQEFLSSMGIDENSQDYQVESSNYSPYVQISYEDKATFEKYKNKYIDKAQSNSDISEIHVTVPVEIKEQANISSDSTTPYYMNDALSDIGADDQTYTGAGLCVGIIEARGIADTSHAELADLNIHTAGDSSTVGVHATNVTRLLCGEEGVARGVSNVYVYHVSKASSYIPAMNWFIENHCSVVNASLGHSSLAGTYHWVSAFMDYQVRYNRIIFVNSAGNNGADANHYVTPPATGYNVITVANSTKGAYIHESSPYDAEEDLKMNKPTIAAPGTGLYLRGAKLGKNSNYGTSYSAPIVAGVVLKLLEEYPTLQLFPEAFSAILMASATKANGQNDKWDKRAGAGIVNYARAREILNNSNSVILYNNDDLPTNIIKSSKEFYAKSGDTIRATAFWLANSTTSAWGDSVQSNIHTDYDLILRYVGSDNEILMRQGTEKSNMEFFIYKIRLLPQSTFRFDIEQISNKKTKIGEYIAIAWYIE